ncbi:MAG: Rieske 2Fe-2S domain-containing protein, partial [Actinomycetota bacterium]|nr:Rieske 2Fe-2S domain-containing protein [Actinomycetota bacterium]
AKGFLPTDELTEERGEVASTEEEVAAFAASLQVGEGTLERRGLLIRLGIGALGALGLAALFPVRSLGPRPGRGLKQTPWARGVRVVVDDNQPVRPEDVGVGGLITVFPEDQTNAADAPALLVRTEPGEQEAEPGREGWTVDGIVAYSKLCTHLGCPVGLYQAREKLLLCPCHQSTFDVTEGARPVFGPATRPLPQLPLGVDDDGYLVAQGDFSDPVGGGFWDRGR